MFWLITLLFSSLYIPLLLSPLSLLLTPTQICGYVMTSKFDANLSLFAFLCEQRFIPKTLTKLFCHLNSFSILIESSAKIPVKKMNKPKITFGKIQLNVKKDEPIEINKAEEEKKAEAASTSG